MGSIGFVLYLLCCIVDPPFTFFLRLQLGANKSSLVTTTSSLGMWVPVHDDECDGDVPIAFQDKKGASKDPEDGKVVFKRDVLPWHVGLYEVRYHHD